jgi:hypothetical protein
VELLASLGDGFAQGAAAHQRRVEIGDELRRCHHVDVVAHRHHPADAGVHDFLGERTPGPGATVGIGGGGDRVVVGRVGVGRAAGVQDQHRDAGLDQQVGELGSVDETLIALDVGILENQVAVASRTRGPRVDLGREASGVELQGVVAGKVEVGAVAIEVDDMVGTSGLVGPAQRLSEALEGRGGAARRAGRLRAPTGRVP